jgi:glucose-1-phosphate cytidylyltransferase
MKVVILCGGQGTRIRDVSEDAPKPMIPVGGFPIVWHIMKYYSTCGHNEFVLCLGYKGQVIKDFFLNYESRTRDLTLRLVTPKNIDYHTQHDESDWVVTLADTGAQAMTGARIRKIRNYIGDDENFMLTYGDGVGDVDIDKLLAFHRRHGKLVTVTGVRPPGRFGEMMSNGSGQVAEFNEKPQATGGRISGGFFVCQREVFDYLGDGDGLVFEEGPMRKLVKDSQLMMYEHDGFWQPMDTYRDYMYLNGLVAKGEAPWIKW